MPTDENVDKSWEGFSEVQKLTKKNENLVRALDDANKQVAQLSARLETDGPGPAADARESKIVEVSKKNRALTLSVERERAAKLRALAQLKSAQVRLDTLDSERTESEVERACREVVEEASRATETAQNEMAAMREKWKQASARAERFSGQKAFIKTENDRLKGIIRREVGEHVDFGRLDDEIAATGGKKGRAATIRDLNMRLGLLRVQLAEANDALAAVAAGPETQALVPVLEPHLPPGEVGGEEVVPPETPGDVEGAPPGGLPKPDAKRSDETRALRDRETSSRAAAAERLSASRADAQARRLEATAVELEAARVSLATEREDAALLAKMNRNLETEVRSLLEKVVVLKDKSDHDDRLVDALREETRRLRTASAEETVSEVSEHAGFSPTDSGNGTVPLAEYRSMEARASSLEAKLRKQEQIALHARAKNASLEQALEREARDPEDDGEEAFSPAAIAAAAGGADAGAGAQHDEDVANLVEHSEALERVCQEMKGKLLVAEKQVAQLREQVQAERRKYQDVTRRMERAAGAGEGGGDAAALRAALAESREETQRVRSKYEGKLDEMEREVELYAEMMTEMKRAATDSKAPKGGSPALTRRKGLPG